MQGEPTRIRLPVTLDPTSVAALVSTLDRPPATGVLVLEGGDGVFCRGLDLQTVRDEEARRRLEPALTQFGHCLVALRCCPLPTVALVDGEALAGGLGLAGACDLVIATERASFGLPELLFGLVPAMILPVLRERMHPQRARLLALEGRSIGPAEALAIGLADRVVPSSDLEQALERSLRLLSRAERGAIGTLRRLCSEALVPSIARGTDVTRDAIESPAALARIAAFEAGGIPWEAP